ncbi:MAG: SDR family NAD(P)-dependent oxidoreductase [Oligoflexus sp.]
MKEPTNLREPLAVVGLSCLFPDAESIGEYWNNIKAGRDSIREIPLTHWQPDDYFDADQKRRDHTYARRGGFLRPYRFDPLRYGITPQSLEATDTTQLLGMVVAEEALRHAGYGPEAEFDRDRVSCILGVTGTLELVIPLGARLGHPHWRRALQRAGLPEGEVEAIVADIADSFVDWQENSFPGLLGNVVAGRIANRLNLGGTNAVVDAACASSLSALQTAMMELETGRADMVITGGMDTFNDIFMYMCFSKTPALSASGDAKPFDADGDGTILGEGLGAVVIKRLSDAERDGDQIYAVIKSMGSSSDGRGKAIYAPSAKGQVKALQRAYARAGIEPQTVELVECHGTGTKVGDGVEIEALSGVYSSEAEISLPRIQTIIGSVKSQIGHTKAAAGVAGLIKVVLALYYKVLPPTIKLKKALPKLLDSPFATQDKARPWVGSDQHPRRAAVSAFGFGGSNFHCVLEEYESRKQEVDCSDDALVLPLAADSQAQLLTTLQDLRQRLAAENGPYRWEWAKQLVNQQIASLDLHASHRLAIVCLKDEDLGKKCRQAEEQMQRQASAGHWVHPSGIYYGSGDKSGSIAFIFSGQGSQYLDMLRPLAIQYPEMIDSLQLANRVWAEQNPEADRRLSDYIYSPARFDKSRSDLEAELKNTAVAQPAIGAVSAGLLKVLEGFGVYPDLVAGHSFGELTALHAAGVLSADDFMRVACLRGQVMHNLDRNLGTMLAIRASLDEVEEFCTRFAWDVVVANHNAPKQVVIAGSAEEIERAWQDLRELKVNTTRLNVAAAFHSPIVAPAVAPFHQALQQIPVHTSRLPVYSNVGPRLYPDSASDIRSQLSSQIVEPVRFVGMVRSMYEQGARTFIEVGPQKVLTGLLRSIFEQDSNTEPVNILAVDEGSADDKGQGLLKVLAQVFTGGVRVDWAKLQMPVFTNQTLGQGTGNKAFHVEICGANYQSPQRREKQAKITDYKVRKLEKKKEAPAAKAESQSQQSHVAVAAFDRNKARSKVEGIAMKESQERPATQQPESLRILEKHLLAMQEMQARNAELHQKYLEGQAATQKVIGDLLQDYRQLMGLTAPSPSTSTSTSTSKAETIPAVSPTQQSPSVAPVRHEPVQPVAAVKTPAPQQANPADPPRKVEQDRSEELPVILKLIAEKTGYPTDMLNPDMHLESDLGIDSIKRVEIFAALQDEFPVLAGLAADQLAQMESIADILTLVGQSSSSSSSSVASSTADPVAASSDVVSTANPEPGASEGHEQPSGDGYTANAILQVISEKTGYPVDMLSLEMDLEADLGIDSIKRVEIFSELQQQSGEAYAADVLNEVHTITDIVQLVSRGSEEQGAADSATNHPEEPPSQQAASDSEQMRLGATASPQALETTAGHLMRVISEKTGYPVEMLQVDMDLEADLGIDSIKRVEIFSALGEDFPQIAAADQQVISEAHSIADLMKLLAADEAAESFDPFDDLGESAQSSEPGQRLNHPEMALVPQDIQLSRSVLEYEEITDLGEGWVELPKEAKVWVTDDGSNLARNIVLKLREKGYKPRLVSISFVDRMKAPDSLDGLILLAPQKIEGSVPRFLTNAFKLVKMVGPALRSAGQKDESASRSLLTIVTRNGGYFGLQGLDHGYLAYSAALAGLAKTLRQEWQEVLVTAIDLGKNFADGFEAAQRLLEACRQTKEVELGVLSQHFVRPVLVDREVGDLNPIQFGIEDNILITGGARGVTFAVAHRLAHDFQCRLIIWGRTELKDEPEYLQNLHEEAAIIQAMREQQGDRQQRSPKEWLQECRQLLAQREVKRNLQKLRDLGADVIYQTVDVRSDQQIATAIDYLKNEGIIPTGLVHGAGILADRRVEDLEEKDFLAVIETKIRLLAHLDREIWQNLRFSVFFSSSTGRFGRVGQAAYAVANEALNKYAHYMQHKLSHGRALAINWGPWDGGMVDAQLKKIFEQEGLATIPLTLGADFLLQELAQRHRHGVEIVCLAKESSESTSPSIHDVIILDAENFPVLRSHVMKGQMVLPVVLHLELMIEKVKRSIPGLRFQGFGNFRILRGLKLHEHESLELRLVLGEQHSVSGGLKVDVTLEAYDFSRRSWYASSATEVWMVDEKVVVTHPVLQVESELELPEKEELYVEFLFHGAHFQGIEEMHALSQSGAEAWVKTSAVPRYWLSNDLLEEWHIDPLAVDCGFQLGVVWSSVTRSLRSLPMSIHTYLQYQDRFPSDGCRVRFVVQESGDKEFEASMEFMDREGRLIASMKGYRGIMDESLKAAFKERHLLEPQTDSI